VGVHPKYAAEERWCGCGLPIEGNGRFCADCQKAKLKGLVTVHHIAGYVPPKGMIALSLLGNVVKLGSFR
jgi:hypothetical protein